MRQRASVDVEPAAVPMSGSVAVSAGPFTAETVAAFVTILEESTNPADARDIAAALRFYEEDGLQLVIAMVGGEPVGGLVIEPIAALRVHYGWYMAVRPRLRSRGSGSRILRAALNGSARTGWDFFVEVEAPRSRERDESDAWRRIEFYERNGLRLQPLTEYGVAADAASAPEPYWIMASCDFSAETLISMLTYVFTESRLEADVTASVTPEVAELLKWSVASVGSVPLVREEALMWSQERIGR